MKILSYSLLLFLSAIVLGCAETEQPYVGYIVIGRAVVDASTNSSATITAETDIASPIIMEIDEEGAAWCNVSANGKEITVTTTQANTEAAYRTATVNVKCGYRATSFTVLQKYQGQEYLEYDWTKWTATGSDVQANDGGGYPSLFTEDRTKFWHSQYSPALANPLPHWLLIDMKEELTCHMFRIGRRHYALNGNNYPTVKVMEIHVSVDNENFTPAGSFTFALPWTAPDKTIVTGNSPKVPAYEDVALSEPVTARYVKLIITETNNAAGTAQVAYFKAYEKI
jgi:hypothetical protein